MLNKKDDRLNSVHISLVFICHTQLESYRENETGVNDSLVQKLLAIIIRALRKGEGSLSREEETGWGEKVGGMGSEGTMNLCSVNLCRNREDVDMYIEISKLIYFIITKTRMKSCCQGFVLSLFRTVLQELEESNDHKQTMT